MKSYIRILSIAGLGLGFAFAANAAAVRSDASLQGDLMHCGSCGKDKKECPKDGDKKGGEKKDAPKPQSALAGGFQADVMQCGGCGKDKKEGEKKEGEKKTSTMSTLGECNKDKKECPKDKDKDKQTADDEKKKDEGCPSGGCGKKKQS